MMDSAITSRTDRCNRPWLGGSRHGRTPPQALNCVGHPGRREQSLGPVAGGLGDSRRSMNSSFHPSLVTGRYGLGSKGSSRRNAG